MSTESLEQLRFPVGRFKFPENPSNVVVKGWIEDIASLPKKLKAVVEPLSEEQLNTPYRPEGWTVRQLVHHVADSHMNSYTRFKLALTETNPTIKPYDEGEWAKLPDTFETPVYVSLVLLEALHHRWTKILESLDEKDMERTFTHPESKRVWTLKETIALYSWHSNHHLAHITSLIERNGW